METTASIEPPVLNVTGPTLVEEREPASSEAVYYPPAERLVAHLNRVPAVETPALQVAAADREVPLTWADQLEASMAADRRLFERIDLSAGRTLKSVCTGC